MKTESTIRLIPQPNYIKETGGFSSVKNISEYINDKNISCDEGYKLKISDSAVKAYASDKKGFYYADVTFNQIKSLYEKIPCCEIIDSPVFSYRGFMIDCARHIFSVDELKKMITGAALLKFNRFHWHLSDDQGFRIEFSSAPELAVKGSVRNGDNFGLHCRSDEPYGGYYTVDEIKDIISFCHEKNIEVIPEFDMPGHVSAFLHVFPQFSCEGKAVEIKDTNGIFKDVLCAGNDEAVEFMKSLVSEICDIFPGQFIHIGGDEAPRVKWKSCEKCQKKIKELGLKDENELQSWFINTINEVIRNNNKTAIVWNDCLKGENLSNNIVIEHWLKSTGRTSEVANKGQMVILAPFTPYYCDYPYGMHPLKSVYNFMPEKFKGLNAEGRKSVIGIESPVWTEFINSDKRLEYMCFPRWFAVAETAWTESSQKNYNDFESAVMKLCRVFNRIAINTAPADDWNKVWYKRLCETKKFFSDIKKKK